jgi:hypothetical protein
MKRGLADEYHKVRRRAEFKAEARQAIDDDESDEFGRDPMVGEHLKQLAAEMHAKAAAEHAKAEKEAKERKDALSKRANQIARLREWQSIGVKPPHVDKDGWPTVTLSMYISLGWQVAIDDEGDKVLVPPPKPPDPRERETTYREMGS